MKIVQYRSDAHHYNNLTLKENFHNIYNFAIDKYRDLSKKLNIKMHNLSYIKDSFSEYLKLKNQQSLSATTREEKTIHKFEFVHYQKALIEISNFYEGKYYLTIDEVYKDSDGLLVLRESKNSINSFPRITKIQDAFFKCLLFVNIDELYEKHTNKKIDFKVEVLLSGKIVEKECEIFSNDTIDVVKNKIHLSLPKFSVNKINKLSFEIYDFISHTKCKVRLKKYEY